MKLRRIFAAVAACAIAATSVISASAKITNENTGSTNPYKYEFNVELPEGVKHNDVYGVLLTYTGTAAEGQSNVGAIAWQSGNVNWTQKEFSLPTDEAKDLTVDNNTVKLLNAEPLFAENEEWAQIVIAQWVWNDDNQMDFAVDSIKLLDKDGNELKAKTTTPDSNTDKEEPSSEAPKDESTKPADDSNKPTGATAGLALAGLAIAGVAVVASKKSK